ncbi:hypothetical protein ES703_51344 [subsurface metagenome]
MDSEAKVALPLKVIRVWGKRAILRRARKGYECSCCGLPIEKGKDYYCVYICGAGLKDKIFPARVRVECIHDYLNFGGKKGHGDSS